MDALLSSCEKGSNISEAVPALGKALSGGENDIKWKAVRVLETAAEKGGDEAIAVLGDALSYEEDGARWNSIWALGEAAKRGNRQTREKVVSEIMKFLKSEWFLKEARQNSDQYLQLMGKLDRILQAMSRAERKVA